jgi:uncharacterized coiled-coil protein SlyX
MLESKCTEPQILLAEEHLERLNQIIVELQEYCDRNQDGLTPDYITQTFIAPIQRAISFDKNINASGNQPIQTLELLIEVQPLLLEYHGIDISQIVDETKERADQLYYGESIYKLARPKLENELLLGMLGDLQEKCLEFATKMEVSMSDDSELKLRLAKKAVIALEHLRNASAKYSEGYIGEALQFFVQSRKHYFELASILQGQRHVIAKYDNQFDHSITDFRSNYSVVLASFSNTVNQVISHNPRLKLR